MADPEYELEFYEDAQGVSAVYRWLAEELDRPARTMLGMLILHVLQERGTSVASTHWGKTLGQGLYEFRTRHTPEEVLAMFGFKSRKKTLAPGSGRRLTLRLFFHVHGRRVVLLLGGYDKGRHPAKTKQQQREINLARERLADWRRRHGAAG